MPRRTYDERAGRRRGFPGAGSTWLASMRSLLDRDMHHRATNGRNTR